MAWTIGDKSGPFPAPWEGRDTTGWMWEIYSGEESRRILVEVSGTAMAIADEYLPPETREARATSGRSEVEKVLGFDEPPRRISLGTTGYFGGTPAETSRADFLIRDRNGQFVAAIEVKNPETLTLPLASEVRDRIAPIDQPAVVRYVLVIAQNKAYLFDGGRRDYGPVSEIPMFDVVQGYYPLATQDQRFRGSELAILIEQWLRDLVAGAVVEDRAAENLLDEHGFLAAVRGGEVEVQPG